jgi:hypothetical protein
MQLDAFLTPEMIAIFIGALMTIFTAVATYGVNTFKLYLQSKMSVNQWDFLKSQAATAVKSLEQSPAYSGLEGAKKKEAAVYYILKQAEAAGIPMTYELADKLIEEAVHDMKSVGYELFDLEIPEPDPATFAGAIQG